MAIDLPSRQINEFSQKEETEKNWVSGQTCGAYSTSKWILAVLGSRSAEFWALNIRKKTFTHFHFRRQLNLLSALPGKWLLCCDRLFLQSWWGLKLLWHALYFRCLLFLWQWRGLGRRPQHSWSPDQFRPAKLSVRSPERRYYTFRAFLKKLFQKFFWF